MKRIDLNAYDVPEIVARCVEVPDVGAPAPGEVGRRTAPEAGAAG